MPDFAHIRTEIRSYLSNLDEVLNRTRAGKTRYPLAPDLFSSMKARRDWLAIIDSHLPVWENRYEAMTDASRVIFEQIESDLIGGQFESAAELIATVPIRRRLADFGAFSAAAEAISRVRSESRQGLFNGKPRESVVNSIAHWFDQKAVRRTPADVFETCLSDAILPNSWSVHLPAVFYWIAHQAEHNLLDFLPVEPDEELCNTRLISSLADTARARGRELTSLLGYDKTVPVEVGLLETEKQKKTESNTGADFILIVYIMFENGKGCTFAALVQGKMETGEYVTNVFRKKTATFGTNHQIRALTAPNRNGYYCVYPIDSELRPIVVAPANDFLSQVLANNPDTDDVSRLRESQCGVKTDSAGVDLATFLGKVLFQRKHRFATIGKAVGTLGEPIKELGPKAADTASILAKRLVLVEVGGRVPEKHMREIRALGYKRREPPALTPAFGGPTR